MYRCCSTGRENPAGRQVVAAVAAAAPAHGVNDFVVVSRSHPQRRDAVMVMIYIYI